MFDRSLQSGLVPSGGVAFEDRLVVELERGREW
jgi:hypothetical protein